MQSDVSNPAVSAWVAANAGSGKTHVLARRVINLLLDDIAPEKILCITFTKAAAANMAKRVFDTLGEWTTLDDAGLDEAIREGSATPPDARRRALARRLFARALETPGGLKVQTIHAFCTQLLHQFPFEANVAARFTVLDDSAHAHLLEQLTLAVLLDGAAAPDGALGRALAAAMIVAADQTFRDVVREAIGEREAISRWVMAAGGVEAAIANLSTRLGIDPADSRERIEADFFAASLIAPAEWSALAKTLAKGAKTDVEQARRFAALDALADTERVDKYIEIFCTQGSAARKSIVTGAIDDAALVERLRAEQDRVCTLLERRRAVACRDRSAALVTIAHEVLSRYEAEKQRRGLLDYDDLIDKTLQLLTKVEAAWVHYKLDLGIDHLLIDEAQDTSKKQWEIVTRLVAEFTAGAGAGPARERSSPSATRSSRSIRFRMPHPGNLRPWGGVLRAPMSRARRHLFSAGLSTPSVPASNVLAAVDEVFKRRERGSVTTDTGFPAHIALPDAPPSLVEIWEPTETGRAQRDRGLGRSVRPGERDQPARETRAADRAHGAKPDRWRGVGIARRAARYGDILILVRQRGELFEAIIRALKKESIVVAGADRLVLTEHIAVMDLMALADALLLPQDDLALATVLRSPLFGFEDADLFAVAADRGGASLRAALAGKAVQQPLFAEAAAQLDVLAEAARSGTPFAFYAHILGAGGARRRSSPGSASRRTTRSTNSSISPSTTSGARHRRCRASSPGCARRAPR